MSRPLASRSTRTIALLLAWASLGSACAAAAPGSTMYYRNGHYGFAISVPEDVFQPAETRNPEYGAAWASADGQAMLYAVAGPNTAGKSIESYRSYVLATSYPGAQVDYAPTRATWFVLSGTMAGTAFYERINFVCGGRYIYGWKMTFPTAQRRTYEPVIDFVHRNYKVGNGEKGGGCG